MNTVSSIYRVSFSDESGNLRSRSIQANSPEIARSLFRRLERVGRSQSLTVEVEKKNVPIRPIPVESLLSSTRKPVKPLRFSTSLRVQQKLLKPKQ